MRATYAAIVRVDQCDIPLSSGGEVLVSVRIRARTRAGTCSRDAPVRLEARAPTPADSNRPSHRSTVGRETPASTAISFFPLPSARHNTIRARVATIAGTSRPRVSATNADRSSALNSTRTFNTRTRVT